MAKRKTAAVSKSAAIREYISANPSAGPTAIYDALTKQGIKDSKGLVSVVKYSKPKPGKRRDQPAKTQTASTKSVIKALLSGPMPASDLIAAKELADTVSSIARARGALDLLEKLS